MVLDLAQIVFKSTVFCSLACALSAGCSKTVVLGSECPAHEGPCEGIDFLPVSDPRQVDANVVGGSVTIVDAGGSPMNPAPASDDAGFRAPDEPRAPIDIPPPQAPQDAGTGPTTDAAPPTIPDAAATEDASAGLLRNTSFELSADPVFGTIQNQIGSDVLVSRLAGYVPRADEFFASIDPWFACWVGARVESDLGGRVAGGLGATLGEALISTGYDPYNPLPGLFQILETPLKAGQTYSFTLDAINSGPGRSALWIGAVNIPCTIPDVYDATPEITNRTSWKEYCVTFRATRSLNTFAIVPMDVADGGVGTISFDNIQQVDSCP
jgi:hypothetical protein